MLRPNLLFSSRGAEQQGPAHEEQQHRPDHSALNRQNTSLALEPADDGA
jgi:hypothetical protein